jgi:hypothetical protein
MFEDVYVREKLADMERHVRRWEREKAADPRAEIPRTGIGIKHEVFRRIVGDAQPKRPPLWRRLTA